MKFVPFNFQKMAGIKLQLIISAIFLCTSAQRNNHPSPIFRNRNIHSTHQQGRAIASSSNSPGSFVIQMPFSVVSKKEHENQYRPSGSTYQPPRRSETGLQSNVPTLVSIGDKGDKINFYTIKCSSGELCSSIIPAQIVTTTEAPQRKRTAEEMRRYLRSYNLGNGFGYNSQGGEPDAASKYFDDHKKEKEKLREARQLRFRDFRDYEDFWPGANLRPNRQRQPKKISNIPSIFPEVGSQNPSALSSLSSSWPRGVNIVTRPSLFPQRREEGRSFTSQLPFPTFENSLEWPYSDFKNPDSKEFKQNYDGYFDHSSEIKSPSENWHKKSKQKPKNKDGEWRLFSTSTVSQLDKQSGKWKKVSTGSNKVNTAKNDKYFPSGHDYKRPFSQYRPPVKPQKPYKKPSKGSTTLEQTITGLTVLGVTEQTPYRPPSTHRPNISISSSGYFPQRPWGSDSKTRPNHPRPSSNESTDPLVPVSASTHVSYPLYVLPPDPNSNTSSVDDPGVALKKSLTSTTTTTTTTTTRRTTIRTTPRTTTTTQAPSGGGGEGGGGFLGNPYAVIAAVGAGLIPATFAALLPAFLGKRKRRRRRRSLKKISDPVKAAPTLPFSPLLPISMNSIKRKRFPKQFKI